MIKKILSWLMVVCLLLSYIPTVAFATENGSGSGEGVNTPAACEHDYKGGVCTMCGKEEPVECQHTATHTEETVSEETTCEHNYVEGECAVCGDKITRGYMLYILNGDGTVAMEINGSKSASEFSLKTSLEDARVFADNGFLFGITGTPSIIVEMYEDSHESASFTIGSDVTIKGNGHSIILADGVTLDASKANLSNVTIVEPKVYIAQIGEQKFESLQAAIDAAGEGDTIILMDALTIVGETFTIPAEKSITLDMNGKKITATDNKAANVSYELFYIYGELTVTGNGTIELTSTSNDTAWAKSSTIFHNRGGKLIIKNGTFKHLGGTAMAFVVDNSANSYGDATTNIAGGELSSAYIAIRNRMERGNLNGNPGNGKAILNISGGTISGVSRAVWAQASSVDTTYPATGEINVSGGKIGLIDTARSAGATSMTTITGGEVSAFKGEVGELIVKDGTITGIVTILSAGGETVDFIVDENGKYVEAPAVTYVAQIRDTYYATLAEAAAAAQAGDEIVLLADATVEGTLALPAGITLTSNGHTITGNIRMLGDLTLNGALTITGGLWVGKSGETLTATLSGDKLTASYFMFQRGTYTINADIDAVYGYLSFEATFNVNSTIHTTGANGEVLYINGKVTLNNGAVLDSDNSVFLNNDAAVLTMKPGSKVDSNLNITASGAKLCIDVTGLAAGEYTGITGTVTNSVNGTIEVVNNDKLEAKIVDGKIVLSAKPVAMIGTQSYATLAEAIAAAQTGDIIKLLAHVAVDADNTITIPTGMKLVLDLNGFTLTGESDQTGSNRNMFDVRGELTVKNGTISYQHVGANMGWGSSTNVFNVTAGGVLNIEDALIENKGGSDMNFVAHLNNWGEVTLNVESSTLKAGYIPVRVFNSGNDMNNVTIKDSTLESTAGNRALWVHNYINDLSGTAAETIEARLNFDIFGNGNQFVVAKADAYRVIEYGFSNVLNLDADGNYVARNEWALNYALSKGGKVTLGADITASKVILIDKSVTIDGNNHTITSSATRIFRITTGNVQVTMNDLNIVSTAVRAEGVDSIRGISVDGGFTGIELTLNDCSVDFTDATASDCSYAVNIVGGSNHTLTVNGGTYEGANVINLWGTDHKVTITGATLNNIYGINDKYYGGIVRVESQIDELTLKNNTFNGTHAKVISYAANASVESLVEENNIDNTKRYVVKVGSNYYYTLEDAIAAATEGDTVTLLASITSSAIITIDKAITLDGNGKKLTSTAARAINVSGADGVTIKNLTIDAKGERAINVIKNATNVTIDNVTATAANYTVNVASSTTNAVVAIKNSTLNGLCTVNVASAGAKVTVDNSTVNCNDNNTTAGESYAALCLNKAAVGGSIVATNTTVNVTAGSDSTKGRNGAENGTVTINGSTEGVTVTVAVITYPGSDNYHGFKTLAEAIEFAKAGDTIILIRDIELTEGVTVPAGKNITLDLNGKTITGTDSNVDSKTSRDNFYLINNTGNLTIKDSVGGGKITLEALNDRDINSSSVVIANNPGGKLVVKSGTVEHLGGTYMAYAIDNLTNGTGTYAETVINGGTIKSTYRAIRQFLNGVEAQNILTINGGTIEGTNKAVFFHDPSKNANSGTLTIGADADVKGDIYLFVTDGSTEWPVTVSIAASALGGEIVTKNVPDTYEVEKSNGVYTILPATRVDVSEEALEDILGEIVDNSVTDEEEKEAITEVVTDTVVEIESNTALNDVDYKPVDEHEDVEKLEVTLQDMEVVVSGDAEKTATVIEVTYHVVPMKNDEKVSKPSKPITFRLPIPESMCVNNAYAEVYHEGVLIGVYEIKGDNGGYYVEVTSAEFSAFTVKPVAQNVAYVASIGKVGYTTLAEAFAAAQDGNTIEILCDITLTKETGAISGSYVDGLLYTGDKSFTVDFNGYTITENGEINDYLVYLNNKGSKDNVITFTNGKILVNSESTATVWAAITVGSPSSTAKTTLNLNGMEVVNGNPNNEHNQLIRIRNGAVVNLNEGTVATSNGTSYGVVAQADSTVNINNGAKVVHTNSKTTGGNLVYTAVSGNGVINVYEGAVIESDNYGIHNMTTGNAVINIYGGTITAPVAVKASTNGGAGETATVKIEGGTFNGKLDTYSNAATIAVSGGVFTVAVPEKYCAEGFQPKDNGDGTYGVQKAKVYVAQVGTEQYESLQAAINAVQNGQTIVLIADITVEEANATNGNAVYYTGDKSFTIDLNGKTVTGNTSNVVFRFQKAEGGAENTITIKNGKVVAKENTWSAISVGSSADTKTNIILTGLEIEACKRNDFAVRARPGAIFTITDCTITAKAYGGGVAAGGGEVTMTDVTINQYGLDASAPWNSAAFGISGGGKMTINSGSYYATPKEAADGNNQGASHGSFVGIIMNSGGTLIINGGTFTNDNSGDNALATAARGLIEADTGAVVEINGGTFNGLKSILAMTNNLGDASKNPSATIKGGTFSADPRVSGLHASNLIKIADGYVVTEKDGEYTVAKAVAKIGGAYYATLAEAAAAAQAGDEIVLLADATVEGTLALPAGITLTSNGHTITGSIRMLGDLELNGPLTITGGLWVGKSGETLTATLSGDKLTAGFFMFQRGTYTINADIDAVYGYLSFEGTFEVNSTIHTTGANGEVLYINGNVTLNNGAVLDSDNNVFLSNDAAVLTMKPGSKVDSKLNLTKSGAKLCIDVTGLTAGEYTGITGTVTNNGTIEVVNNDDMEAKIVNGKIVLVEKVYVAQIGEKKFESLQEAIEAADGDTIMLIADVELQDTLKIPYGTTVILDLNGKTISQKKSQTAHYEMILVDGNLTIEDSVGGGKISYTDLGNGGEYGSNTITNRGTLTVKSGTIENLSSETVAYNGYPYAIDSSIWGAAAEVNTVINGGTVSCATYSAIRLRGDSATKAVNVTINGGVIRGTIEVQNSSGAAAAGKLTVTGGELSNSGTANVLFVFGNGQKTALKIEISGGSFTGKVTVRDNISSDFDKGFISGGTFKTDVSEFVADGYQCKDNGGGTYGVEEKVTKKYQFGQTSQIWLIEPWALRANLYVYHENSDGSRGAELTADELAKFEDFGVYFIRESDLGFTDANQNNVTIEDIINNENVILKTMRNGCFIKSADRNGIWADFDEGIYTYQLSDSIFVLYYIVVDGETIYAPIRERNLSEMVEAGITDTKNYTETERAIFEKMHQLEIDILEYRGGAHDTTLEIMDAPTLGQNPLGNVAAHNLNFGHTTAVSLIEPWGIQFNGRVALDKEYDDYGVIVFYDTENVIEGTVTAEMLLAMENAYVFSYVNGDATIAIDSDGRTRITALYNAGLYTYQMRRIAYVMFYVKDGDNVYCGPVKERSIESAIHSRLNVAGVADTLEGKILQDMLALYEVTAKHRGVE